MGPCRVTCDGQHVWPLFDLSSLALPAGRRSDAVLAARGWACGHALQPARWAALCVNDAFAFCSPLLLYCKVFVSQVAEMQ